MVEIAEHVVPQAEQILKVLGAGEQRAAPAYRP